MTRTFLPHVITDDSALGGLEIERSFRFNDNDNAYLFRTPSSAGNRKTWTLSVWVKRTVIDTNQRIFTAYDGSNINAECILDNGKSLNISQLSSLIKDSTFVIANDTGPAHITAHLGVRGLALFGPHKSAKLVSIEREKFRAIQVEDLNKLSADKVFERMLELLA